jgi:hypothetical protein
VELQSEALSRHGGSPAEPPGAETQREPTHAPPTNGAQSDHSVLDSVMEQFQTLQKTKVRKLARSKR